MTTVRRQLALLSFRLLFEIFIVRYLSHIRPVSSCIQAGNERTSLRLVAFATLQHAL